MGRVVTMYDFQEAHDILTRWLHYNYCNLPDCQDKGIWDTPCRDDQFRFKAGFMIAAVAPAFIKEIKYADRGAAGLDPGQLGEDQRAQGVPE